MTKWNDPVLDSIGPAIDRLFEDQKRIATEMALFVKETGNQPLSRDQEERLAALKAQWTEIPQKIVRLVQLAVKTPTGRSDH